MRKTRNLILFSLIATLFCRTQFPTQNVSAAEQPTQEQVTTENSTAAQSEFITSKLSPTRSKIIVLDPGHCSSHTGARGNGLKEEKVVLDIATSCKNELNNYGDVTVYMTRETNKCCQNPGLGDCLTSRNNYAQRLDADFLISMHINADKKSRTNGANVLAAYKSGYHDPIRVQTQAIGKTILSNLQSIGIKNDGLLLRKLKNSRYSNGSLKDYYSIVRNGVLNNIPSIIIEHGYITNASDCKNFFSTKSKRKTLGKADADAIISYYGLNQELIDGSFVKNGKITYYVTKDNKKVIGWVKNNGKWYYFDAKGKMKTGFVTINKKTFYLNPSTGEMSVGWFKVKSSNYLSKGDGTVIKNKTYSDGFNTYLFASNGKQVNKGMRTVNGKTYYVNSKTGTVTKNKIVKVKGSKYYFSSNGTRKTGWIKYNGKKYYFSKKTGKLIKQK